MAVRWIVSRILRAFSQKENGLTYMLFYREMQSEIVALANEMGVAPDVLAKEIGKRATTESAERHASAMAIVPINPNNPERIQSYIEMLWEIIFGTHMRGYDIHVDDLTEGHQKITFNLKQCPVCAGFQEDVDRYQELYHTFSGQDVEGYACLMAGMLEQLAAIIMKNKGLGIRMTVRETQCFARGDEAMSVQACIMPVEEYEAMKPVALGISTEVKESKGAEETSVLEGFAETSTRLFERVSETLKLDELDRFFENPSSEVKQRLSTAVEQQLHFTPKEILQYFQNYEEDIFRVIGYLSVHAMNELGGIVQTIASTYLLAKTVDIIVSAIDYGLDAYIPERVIQDEKQVITDLMADWAPESSVEKVKALDGRQMFKLVLEGVKLAFTDYGIEFQGAKEATWELVRRSGAGGEEPSKTFSVLFDVFQEASLVGGYLMSLPVKAMLSAEYESVREPAVSAQESYQASREHLEKLIDLVEQLRDIELVPTAIPTPEARKEQQDLGKRLNRAFPRFF